MENRIPKVIHYCWLGGGKMNHILRHCVKTFPKLMLGGGNVIQWNESNFPAIDNPYTQELYDKKDWGFVSDYLRLKVLYEQGGIYLDTDIQVLKPLPEEWFERDMVWGYAYDDVVCTAFIMVKPKHPFIKYLLDKLESFSGGQREVSNTYFTQAFLDFYPNFRLDGKYREFAPNCFIYPRWYFDSATFRKDGGYTIHHGMGVWHKVSKLKALFRPTVKLMRFYIKPFGVWYQNRVNRKMVQNSGRFLNIYKKTLEV